MQQANPEIKGISHLAGGEYNEPQFFLSLAQPFKKMEGIRPHSSCAYEQMMILWRAAFPRCSSALVKASGKLPLLSITCTERSRNTRLSVDVT